MRVERDRVGSGGVRALQISEFHQLMTHKPRISVCDCKVPLPLSNVQLLSQFDVRDVETTIRTLQAVTKRAAEEAAAPA